MPPEIAILLATYNGARWLPEQLDSLLAQQGVSLHVLVRDDGSTDGTPQLLTEYDLAHPGTFSILPQDGLRLGPRGTFAALLEHALDHPRRFNRFMFCDQDDVWFPQKAATLLAALEALPGSGPRLAHADARVVDQDLEPIAASFWQRARIDPNGIDIRRLLLQNVVMGHCALFDRALAERAVPIPPQAYMHDWWLALTASAFGSITAVREPLSLYRQHGANVEGSRARVLARFLSLQHWRKRILAASLHAVILRHAEAWVDRFASELEPPLATRLSPLRGLSNAGWFTRRVKLLQSGLRPATLRDALDYLVKC